MRVLVACEFSGRVREEFAKLGHEAWSCDVRPTEIPGNHYECDVREVLSDSWDMLIAHPYCTYNTLAGIRWMYHPEDTHLPATERRRHPQYPNRMTDFEEGIEFFELFSKATHIPRRAIENSMPHGLATARLGKYTQMVQPWMFGSAKTKAACLWLYNLPKLKQQYDKDDYDSIYPACFLESPGPDREKNRSRTDPAIAKAFADNWGNL